MGADVNNEQFLEHLLKVPLFPFLPPLSPPPSSFFFFPPLSPFSPPRREELSPACPLTRDRTSPKFGTIGKFGTSHDKLERARDFWNARMSAHAQAQAMIANHYARVI